MTNVASGPTGVSREIRHAVNTALSRAAGGPTAVRSIASIEEGWSAAFADYSWIARCAVDGPPGWGVTSVVVKTRRPSGHPRSGDTIGREWAALAFLEELGSVAGPRVLACDEAMGFLVLEDLGTGTALEDLLVGNDPQTATRGFVALAEAVARMHAATLGRHDASYARMRHLGTSVERDRVCLANVSLSEWWSALRELTARHSVLPDTGAADEDIEAVIAWMTDEDAMLALSNSDLAPQNCRLGPGSARLLDFEGAQFRHILLDAANLRLPFYGGPCWSRIPADVGAQVELAYRRELAAACPSLLDAETYAAGMANATAAWAVVRSVRLPKLLANDDPHPMGFSRRGQLLDTLQVAVDAARTSGTLPALRAWFEETISGLRHHWPHLPPAQQVYPAYRLCSPTAYRE